MRTLRDHLDEYMAFRKARGLVVSMKIERMLAQFISSLPNPGKGGPVFTTDDALVWVNAPSGAKPAWLSARLSMVRQFAIYLAGSGVEVEVPSPRLVPGGGGRAVPYIYTSGDIQSLIEAAHGLHQPLRAATMGILIGLLSVTGMRIGEALGLDVGDLDPGRGTLLVRNAKLGRQRVVMLHESTCRVIQEDYLGSAPRADFSLDPDAPLLTNTLGARLAIGTVNEAWARIRKGADLPPRPGARPRLHDLRHTFATQTMVDAYTQGRTAGQSLAALAVWLGHSSPVFTYWYLQAVPELAAAAISRLDAAEGADR